MSWLAQSVDLNPIELDQKVRAKQPKSVAYIWKLLQECWAELSSVYLQSLAERMLRIFETLITAKEGNFHESKV